ncbi:hypothetical protein BGX34_011897 [Mortierella sp. NVP85]|nr:hypothetical protein BGX34_011897 [Mortierella sp. NVP85]
MDMGRLQTHREQGTEITSTTYYATLATLLQFRGYLLDGMRMYLSISTPKDFQDTFPAVLTQFKTVLATHFSRHLFEFHKDLDPAMVSEIITMHLFVNSSNHEIVKSALGFIKVMTISLDVEIVRPHPQDIVSGIIRLSHQHKGHF